MINVLSLSYGKDSLACIEACKQLGIQIDHIVHAQVWFDAGISGDLPDMEQFKDYADDVIKKRYGLTVERICSDFTYVSVLSSCSKSGKAYGFPSIKANWCNSRLKIGAINKIKKLYGECSSIIGIAADETERLERNQKIPMAIFPLAEIRWNETDCRKWCEDNALLSPLYQRNNRGGCWFCHNQTIAELRFLRNVFPERYYKLLELERYLKDKLGDVPCSNFFMHHSLAEYEKRFCLEDEGLITPETRFKWDMIRNDYPFTLNSLESKDASRGQTKNYRKE